MPRAIVPNRADKEPELIEGDIFQTIVPLSRGSGTSDVSVNVPVNVSVNVSVNATAKQILEYIADNPEITYEELVEKILVSRRTIQRNIVNLKNIGRIRRVGSDKIGH
jgi:predicted HTH transcriptional regulator